MRAVSLKRARQQAEFRPLAAEYLIANPWCEFPDGCNQRSQVVHHRRGRRGERLLDQAWWAASCNFHNDYAEVETGAALDCGWLVRVEGMAS